MTAKQRADKIDFSNCDSAAIFRAKITQAIAEAENAAYDRCLDLILDQTGIDLNSDIAKNIRKLKN